MRATAIWYHLNIRFFSIGIFDPYDTTSCGDSVDSQHGFFTLRRFAITFHVSQGGLLLVNFLTLQRYSVTRFVNGGD